MKKRSKTAKAPVAKKARAKKSPIVKPRRGADPFSSLFENLDERTLETLRQALLSGNDLDDNSNSVPKLLSQFIEDSVNGDLDDDERAAHLMEITDALDDLRVSANGGDRNAREELQTAFDVLDQAVEAKKLHPVDLMTIAKAFADAGLTVPETLKASVASRMETEPGADVATPEKDLVAAMLELAELVENNPFDIHEQLRTMFASLPNSAVLALLDSNFVGRNEMIDQAIVGFALNPSVEIAIAALRALAARAATNPTPSLTIERLVRMRPWVAANRQGEIDATVRAMRQNALPPVKLASATIAKCLVSIRDGSGGASIFVTLKSGTKHHVATVMLKVGGVAETLVMRELPKSQLDEFARHLKTSLPNAETNLAGVAALLALALADNLAAGVPPPFSLVETVEILGLGPLHPDSATTAEILSRVLGDAPAEIDAATTRQASFPVSELVFNSWFEAGEVVEDLLYPIKGYGRRVNRLMNDYLPLRRDYWARQCALSALALRGLGTEPRPDATRLALVGRALAAGIPFAEIPLMKQIAERSVLAFQSRN